MKSHYIAHASLKLLPSSYSPILASQSVGIPGCFPLYIPKCTRTIIEVTSQWQSDVQFLKFATYYSYDIQLFVSFLEMSSVLVVTGNVK